MDRLLRLTALAALTTASSAHEIGSNFPVSGLTPDSMSDVEVAIAHDTQRDRFLVVWWSYFGENDDVEVVGRIVDRDGNDVGLGQVSISDRGLDEEPNQPAVAYSSASDEFLVVWSGSGDIGGALDHEVFGQRIDAATGLQIGVDDFRISDMGAVDSTGNEESYAPHVTHNSVRDEFLVTWNGNDATGGLHAQEVEVYGQRIEAGTGAAVGTNDFRISQAGPDGTKTYAAFGSAVAFRPAHDDYLVVWMADNDVLGDNQWRIYGQRLDALGNEIGDEFQISTDGLAEDPDVAYSPATDEFLAVWTRPGGGVEIHGRFVSGAGVPVGTGDFQVSEMGPDGNASYNGVAGVVTYETSRDEFFVAWYGDTLAPGLVDNEREVFGQWIDASTRLEVGEPNVRISSMGPDLVTWYYGLEPALPAVSTDGRVMVVWIGYDDSNEDAEEIYGQVMGSDKGFEASRQGLSLNPEALLFGQTSGPVLATTWDPVIDHSTFMPGASIDALMVATHPLDLELAPLGTLLVDVTTLIEAFVAAPGVPFALPIPDNAALVGVSLTSQGASTDGFFSSLTNAIDFTVGMY